MNQFLKIISGYRMSQKLENMHIGNNPKCIVSIKSMINEYDEMRQFFNKLCFKTVSLVRGYLEDSGFKVKEFDILKYRRKELPHRYEKIFTDSSIKTTIRILSEYYEVYRSLYEESYDIVLMFRVKTKESIQKNIKKGKYKKDYFMCVDDLIGISVVIRNPEKLSYVVKKILNALTEAVKEERKIVESCKLYNYDMSIHIPSEPKELKYMSIHFKIQIRCNRKILGVEIQFHIDITYLFREISHVLEYKKIENPSESLKALGEIIRKLYSYYVNDEKFWLILKTISDLIE